MKIIGLHHPQYQIERIWVGNNAPSHVHHLFLRCELDTGENETISWCNFSHSPFPMLRLPLDPESGETFGLNNLLPKLMNPLLTFIVRKINRWELVFLTTLDGQISRFDRSFKGRSMVLHKILGRIIFSHQFVDVFIAIACTGEQIAGWTVWNQ